MAYMDAYNQFAAPLTATDVTPVTSGDFSALEWQVIALARRDNLASLQAPGRLSRALGGLFGVAAKSILADPRLEALRRLAVQAWHRGFAVPVSEIVRFKEAGFSIDQVKVLLTSIGASRAAPRRARAAS